MPELPSHEVNYVMYLLNEFEFKYDPKIFDLLELDELLFVKQNLKDIIETKQILRRMENFRGMATKYQIKAIQALSWDVARKDLSTQQLTGLTKQEATKVISELKLRQAFESINLVISETKKDLTV